MKIEDFCVQMQGLKKAEASIESLRKVAQLDLQDLINQGALSSYWDLWNMGEAPSLQAG